MADVFPEIHGQGSRVREIIRREEEAFNKTLDRGIEIFEERDLIKEAADPRGALISVDLGSEDPIKNAIDGNQITAAFAFRLYDTYGFPLDLTELMASELGLTGDSTVF